MSFLRYESLKLELDTRRMVFVDTDDLRGTRKRERSGVDFYL